MSGICGICQSSGQVSRASLELMLKGIQLPDEKQECLIARSQAGFGVMQRWKFQQTCQIQGICLAADADLCNWEELADHLKARGLDSDEITQGEILARLYAAEGWEFIKRLEGAFSIAVWDETSKELLLATDPLGLKTLYWRKEEGCLLFASQVGAVAALQRSSPEVYFPSVVQYFLFSVVPAPLTIYRGTEKLRPGVALRFRDGDARLEQYWDLVYNESGNRDPRYWAAGLRDEMRAAVHRHLDGCKGEETGAYLSGGTDSSSVVSFMAERYPQVNSFSISFPEQGFNEIEFARTTARRFGTRHHERCVEPQDILKAIPLVTSYYDQPFANSSALASYCCALLARENGMNTLLAGDGGDELFAGNERYATDKRFALYHGLPRWFRKGVLEPAAALLPAGDTPLSLPRRYIRRANIPNPRRVFSYNVFLSTDPGEIFEDDFLRAAPADDWLRIAEEHFNQAQASSELNRLMHLDIKIILADNDVRKVSGTAELAGIRVRYPLLDRHLAEFSGRIPTRLKMKGFQKRYIFKKAMQGILPEKVLYKKKHGFGVPIGFWFLRNKELKSLVQDVLNDRKTRQRGYFRAGFYERIADLHQRDHPGFYGEVIWYLVALELWHRQHLECLSHRSALAN